MISESQSVSVVVPVRNSSETVLRAFDSILSQTIRPERIVVVYDESSDNTLEVVNKAATISPNLFQIIQGPGKGIGAARQEAILAVETPYVSFLDSDDWYAPDALESLLAEVNKTGAVCGLVCRVYADGTRRTKYRRGGEDEVTHEMLKVGNSIPMSTTMYRTSLLRKVGGFDGNLLWIEDYDLHLRIAERAPYTSINKVISYYSVHENPTMSRRSHEYAKWTAIVWSKHGFVDWKSIWVSLVYSVTSVLLVPLNMVRKRFRSGVRVFHYEYLQILSGYIIGLARGYRLVA